VLDTFEIVFDTDFAVRPPLIIELKQPSCSFVSANGPSVADILPPRTYRERQV